MSKTTKSGKAKKDELPATLRRSDSKAQRTFAKAHDAAAEEYGDERRAHQVAFAAVKRSHEQVGDHWEPKKKNGPSDDRAAQGRNSSGKTAGGVDANASKKHLLEIARRLKISGRSTMDKAELVKAIQKANHRKSATSRS
jgi:cation transport regulator ChaB